MDNERIIEARNLYKRFRTVTAVAGVSFWVQKGDCYGLLGPNGAGKTSIIRMTYGFSPITSGDLQVFGLDIRRHWREIRSRIGVCQQENTLDPDLTVEENLRLFARYFGISPNRACKRADELFNFFALENKRKSKVVELSGGLARRLTVARSLINHPELVILDEPTTGLDPQSRHLLWDKLMELRNKGTTMVLTTHYMEEASSLCNRLVILDQGKILVEGSPAELIQRHVGESVIEIQGAGKELHDYLKRKNVPFDNAGPNVIVYAGEAEGEHIRMNYCMEKCIFRKATLEDVFLHLTGRTLRE